MGVDEGLSEPTWDAIDPVPGAFGLQAVDSPEVAEVLDRATGQYVSHVEVVGDEYERAMQLRLQMQTDKLRGNSRYCCSMCFVPVYLVMHPSSRKFFLKHTLEDGRCSAITRGELSQEEINARKYNGVKESWLHQEMKRWISDCLRADSQFSDVQVEARWTSKVTGAWRKPDVRAVYKGLPVVFEVQLSTTYINVIAERREFYLKEGGLLFWVFANFDDGQRRLTQDDVFYNNNRNVFIVNRLTRCTSFEERRFMLECVWAEPQAGGDISPLHRSVLAFDTLTFEQSKQRAYHFDFDGEKERMAHEAAEKKAATLQTLRAKFERWFISYVTTDDDSLASWTQLSAEFEAVGFGLPLYPGMLPKPLLKALYSTKHGRVIGWSYPNFIQIAHHIEPGSRHHLHFFRAALKAFDRAELIRSQDLSGKWADKVKAYKVKIREGDDDYAPDNTHRALVQMLFPEMFTSEGMLKL